MSKINILSNMIKDALRFSMNFNRLRKMSRYKSELSTSNNFSSATRHPSKSVDTRCGGQNQKSGPSWQMWKRLSLFAAVPAVVALTGIMMATREHLERPPFVEYSYLRIRNKKFPWGDGTKSLFHNPHLNALPDGYEEELQQNLKEDGTVDDV